jgi:CheY-like chemotaxis protein
MLHQTIALSPRRPALNYLPSQQLSPANRIAITGLHTTTALQSVGNRFWKVLKAIQLGSTTPNSGDSSTPQIASQTGSRSGLAARSGRILVVEDEGIVALDIKMTLRRLGHQVIATVDTGDDAILQAVNQKPDLILMDIRLKGETDGIEATHQIQAVASIPVIYLTGQLDDGTVHRAKTTNPAGYLAKPFTAPELSALIQQVLERFQDRQ